MKDVIIGIGGLIVILVVVGILAMAPLRVLLTAVTGGLPVPVIILVGLLCAWWLYHRIHG